MSTLTEAGGPSSVLFSPVRASEVQHTNLGPKALTIRIRKSQLLAC